ncbi:MAG: hypothetical protein OEU36_07435 [Gammaproteobacteria bacterium]|nr:hypothetical protein [Gammaproteobacteria bacterium]
MTPPSRHGSRHAFVAIGVAGVVASIHEFGFDWLVVNGVGSTGFGTTGGLSGTSCLEVARFWQYS